MCALPRLAQVLRALRAEQGVEQLDLALAMDCADATYLSRLENGRRTNPGAAFLRRYVSSGRVSSNNVISRSFCGNSGMIHLDDADDGSR